MKRGQLKFYASDSKTHLRYWCSKSIRAKLLEGISLSRRFHVLQLIGLICKEEMGMTRTRDMRFLLNLETQSSNTIKMGTWIECSDQECFTNEKTYHNEDLPNRPLGQCEPRIPAPYPLNGEINATLTKICQSFINAVTLFFSQGDQ